MNFYSISLLFTAISSALLGIFVYLQGQRKLSNIALALLAMSIGAWCFGQFMGEAVVSKEAVLFWTRTNIGAAILIPVFYFNFVLAFTDKLETGNKKMLILSYCAAALLLLLDSSPWFVADVAPRIGYRFYPVPGIIYPFFVLYLLLLFGIGLSKLAGFMNQSEGEKKNQAMYVFMASLIGLLGGVTAFFPVFNIRLPVVSYFALPLYLAITAYAIVKHKLLDINIILREGLVYSTLTVFFAGFYALLILLFNRFFQSLTGFNEHAATVFVVFASVLVFQPLRNRIQRGVDRLFFKGEFYYQKTIKDLSAENRKLYRGLLQADKLAALGRIAAGMAHEIKNPLASIKALTQILPENLQDPEFIETYSDIVPRQLDRINRIVEDLLDFGHPKQMVMGEEHVVKVLEDVLKLVENQCRKSNIEIRKEFQAVPSLFADAERLSQALMNIILNAIQAMPGGGQLLVACKILSDNQIEIEIMDTGKGITEDRLPNIFDPFYTTREDGTGMGLSVTYRIIKEHGGEIEVDSEPGAGTTFKICLPIKPKPSA